MSTKTKPGFVIVPSKAPPSVIKKGTTKQCGHPGCTMLLRYTLDGWKHSIRQPYDHKPVG